MKIKVVTALLCSVISAGPAFAGGSAEYPGATPGYPFQRSVLTPRPVEIPPYRHVFRVRTYTTTQQDPYYNVPPYSVIAPY